MRPSARASLTYPVLALAWLQAGRQQPQQSRRLYLNGSARAPQDCEDRDYEPWGNGPCLLGRNYTLWRRQRASECFSGRSYKRPEPAASACPCSVVRRRLPHTFRERSFGCRGGCGLMHCLSVGASPSIRVQASLEEASFLASVTRR